MLKIGFFLWTWIHRLTQLKGLEFDRDHIELSTYNIIVEECNINDVIVPSYIAKLDVAPGSIDLAGADLELANVKKVVNNA